MCWTDEPLYLVDQEILKQSKLSTQKKPISLTKKELVISVSPQTQIWLLAQKKQVEDLFYQGTFKWSGI